MGITFPVEKSENQMVIQKYTQKIFHWFGEIFGYLANISFSSCALFMQISFHQMLDIASDLTEDL